MPFVTDKGHRFVLCALKSNLKMSNSSHRFFTGGTAGKSHAPESAGRKGTVPVLSDVQIRAHLRADRKGCVFSLSRYNLEKDFFGSEARQKRWNLMLFLSFLFHNTFRMRLKNETGQPLFGPSISFFWKNCFTTIARYQR